MKKFLIKVVVFVAPLCLISYGADRLISDTLKKSGNFADGEYPVWNDLYEGKVNSDIVVYGTSRALKHISPRILTDSYGVPAYNLGVNGHTFKSEYYRHSLLLKLNTKPKLIIQTLDVTSFEKISDLYNPDQFLPYMLANKEMEKSVYNGFDHVDYVVPMIRYYGKKEAFLEVLKIILFPGSNKTLRDRGYRPRDESWTDDFLLAQKKIGSLEVKSDSAIVQLFERFLSESKQCSIPVVLVYTPEYIEGQQFVSNRSDIINIYYRLSNKYNIPLLDYSRDSISYKKEYFYNSGHLNKTGAEIFTVMLIEDMKKIMDKSETAMTTSYMFP